MPRCKQRLSKKRKIDQFNMTTDQFDYTNYESDTSNDQFESKLQSKPVDDSNNTQLDPGTVNSNSNNDHTSQK